MAEPLIKELLKTIPQTGKVEFISVRPKRVEMPITKSSVFADDMGLEGDRFNSKTSKKRAVTLIQQEHLAVVASILKKEIDPLLTRRNIVVSGINLISLKGLQFQIGEAIFEGTGECYPCSRMEENLGSGGYNAMRGHGGLTARVIKEGLIKIGDEVKMITSKH